MNRDVDEALDLMRRALALLDRADASHAAARLQMAIDVAEERAVGRRR